MRRIILLLACLVLLISGAIVSLSGRQLPVRSVEFDEKSQRITFYCRGSAYGIAERGFISRIHLADGRRLQTPMQKSRMHLEMGNADNQVWIADNSFYQHQPTLYRWDADTFELVGNTQFQLPIKLATGRFAFGFSDTGIHLLDVKSGQLLDWYDLKSRSLNDIWLTPDPHRFLLDTYGPRVPISQRARGAVVLSVDSGKLVESAILPPMTRYVQIHGEQENMRLIRHIKTPSDDGSRIDVFSATTGEITNWTPLPDMQMPNTSTQTVQMPNVQMTTLPFSLTKDTLVLMTDRFVAGPTSTTYRRANKYIDLASQKELLIPDNFLLVDRAPERSRMLLTSNGEYFVYEEQGIPKKLIRHQGWPGEFSTAQLINDGSQVLFANAKEQVLLFDATTGVLLRRIDPFFWIPWLNGALIIGAIAWAWAWLTVSARLHRHGWIDIAVIVGLSLGYIYLRAQSIGMPEESSRPIYHMSDGIFAGLVCVTLLWCCLGRSSRLITRLLLTMFSAAGAFGFAVVCVGVQNHRFTQTVNVTASMIVILAISFLIARLFGYRFVQDTLTDTVSANGHRHGSSKIRDHSKQNQSPIQLKDLFLMTAAVAMLFASLRYAHFTSRVDIMGLVDLLFISAALFAIPAVAGCRFALIPRGIIHRSVEVVIAFGIAYLFYCLRGNLHLLFPSPGAPNRATFRWPTLHGFYVFLRHFSGAAICAAVSLYAYRLRGWRVRRVSGRVASQPIPRPIAKTEALVESS